MSSKLVVLFLVPAVMALTLSPVPRARDFQDPAQCTLCLSLSAKAYTWDHAMAPPNHLFQSANDGECENLCAQLGNPEQGEDCSFTCSRLSYAASLVNGTARDTCISVGFCEVLGVDPEHMVPLVQTPSKYRPVVLMHGIVSGADSMDDLASWIAETYPGIYIKNVEIGNGFSTSFLMPLSVQISNFCKQMKNDANLAGGFDLIGFSQGTAITRGYIEKCNHPQVRNYISLAGVHGGIFGEGIIPRVIAKAFHYIPYDYWFQRICTCAQLWRDPYDEAAYLKSNIFFPDINNELPKKKLAYKLNLSSLNKMVMMYSAVDNVIRPQAAGWFEFYAPGQDTNVIPLKETQQYKEDWLGVQTLDKTNRLVRYESDCLHTEHVGPECKEFVLANILQYIGV